MDALGFAFATAFLATAFTIFGVIGRIVDGVVGEVRLTIAPTMVEGVKAWGDELREGRRAPSGDSSPGTDRPGGPGGTAAGPPPDRRDHAVVVPVQPLPRRGWHRFGRLLGALAVARRNTHSPA